MPLRALSNARVRRRTSPAPSLAYPDCRRRERWSTERLRAWQLGRVRSLVERAYAVGPRLPRALRRRGLPPGRPPDLGRLRPAADDREGGPRGGLSGAIDGGRHPAGPLPGLDELRVDRSDDGDPPSGRPALAVRPGTTERLFRRLAGRYPPSWRQAYIYTSPYPVRGSLGLYPDDLHPDRGRPGPDARRAAALPTADCWRPTRPSCAISWRPIRRPCGRSTCGESPSRASTRPPTSGAAGPRLLGCPVGDQYSSEELAYIAAECAVGTYHLVEDLTLVEILDQAADQPVDGIGEVVGTELHNRTMPFIRYRQGDLARIETEACPCRPAAGPGRRLSELAGRANDGFVLAGGRTLSAGFLLDACYRAILPRPAEVAAYRLVQVAPDRAVLEVVPGATWSEATVGALSDVLAAQLPPDLRADVRVVERLDRAEAGKRATIVRDRSLSAA